MMHVQVTHWVARHEIIDQIKAKVPLVVILTARYKSCFPWLQPKASLDGGDHNVNETIDN